ncbi:MAG: peroxiredoxin family protein [Pirellulales bacterium]|nr:peroxiredoxin family protein [Pirellulales bacterium]
MKQFAPGTISMRIAELRVGCWCLLMMGLPAGTVQVAAAADVTAQPAVAGGDAAVGPDASAAQGTAPLSSTGPLPGHSMHGEAFNEGPRQRAYLMGGTGKVHFPITCRDAMTQAFFDQGVGQVHGFWFYEAERSFREVALREPECAMAYWGMAVANVNNEARARQFIAKAVERRSQASPREQMYIDAWSAFLAEGSQDPKQRRRQLVRALEDISYAYRDDVEARALLVWTIWQNSSHDLPISSHQAVDALIDQVLAVEPMHPVHHYRIHLWDYEKPSRALASAALCGPAAPSIAHMWHMPGHTYAHVERYADAAWQQEASARVDHAYMMRDRVIPDQIHNYAHNNEWLIRDLSFVGRVHDAVSLAKNLIELPRHPRFNTLQRGGSAQFGRTRLWEVLLRYELWDTLLLLAETPYLEPTDIPEEQIKRLRAMGTAHFGRGDAAAGEAVRAELEGRLAAKVQERDASMAQADAVARAESKPEDQVQQARNQAGQPFAAEIQALESALAELRGWQALAQGEAAKAAAELERASGISKEVLSRIWLEGGDLVRAEQLAREAAAAGRNQVYPLAHLVYVLWRVGKRDEAAEQFGQLRRLAAQADLDVPVMQRLAPLAAELGWPSDWRQSPPAPSDVGERPPLEQLGPLRWQPWPAADFSLPTADGQPVTLRQFSGRPVLLVFYLGHGCLHCVEQLKALAPLTGRFAEAGVEIVAISTDAQPELTKAVERAGVESFPFALAADPQCAVFRAWRAYDDFENVPLHGTFLVDGHGRVRWQDISYQPFTEFEFLLAETRRLLALPQ